jgi:hypothetical protein
LRLAALSLFGLLLRLFEAIAVSELDTKPVPQDT